MAGSATTLLIILLTINIGMLFFGFRSGGTILSDLITGNVESGTVSVSPNIEANIRDMLLGAIITSIASAATVGWLTGKENSLYAGLVTFMLNFAFLPISLFTMASIPIMVKMIFGIPLVFGYIFALIGFFRGYEP